MTKSNGSSKQQPRPLSRSNKIINPNRIVDPKQGQNMRTRATINRLAMYKARAKHDKYGNFISGSYMSRTVDTPVQRIEPNRKWFGNTRVIGQKQLTQFRDEMNIVNNDRYQVVMKPSTLPMSLLNNPFKNTKINILQSEQYNNIINKHKIKRKHPKLQYTDLSTLVEHNTTVSEQYNMDSDIQQRNANIERYTAANSRNDEKKLFEKGQSKRIWSELYKVIDSSDIVIHVLDARDPLGTRCMRIEDELKKPDRRHKQMIYILNKCDLIPTYVTRKWIKYLSTIAPCIAFHASITNSFGKGTLINLLRQFGTLHKDKQQISVGFVGYPNVGKSSIINTLRGKQVCKAAPVPGQTKVWQYITLFKRIFLIDCPGVVHFTEHTDNSDSNTVLKGVIRIENLHNPTEYISGVLKLIKPQYIATAYGITQYTSVDNFLDQYARMTGKLLKGGEPDKQQVARMILNDFQRGKLPYYTVPPNMTELQNDSANNDSGLKVEQLYNKIHVKHNFDGVKDENNTLQSNMNDTTNENVPDWDAEYDNVEGEDMDAEQAEQVLEIEHDDVDSEGSDNDDNDDTEVVHDDDVELQQSDNDNESAADSDNDVDSQSVKSESGGNDNINKTDKTVKINRTKRRRQHKRQQQNTDVATAFLHEPTVVPGNEKVSRQSLNKAKKKRQLAKRKRLRVCK